MRGIISPRKRAASSSTVNLVRSVSVDIPVVRLYQEDAIRKALQDTWVGLRAVASARATAGRAWRCPAPGKQGQTRHHKDEQRSQNEGRRGGHGRVGPGSGRSSDQRQGNRHRRAKMPKAGGDCGKECGRRADAASAFPSPEESGPGWLSGIYPPASVAIGFVFPEFNPSRCAAARF